MKSVEHTKMFDMDFPVAEIFPLFSPEGERLWVPGWSHQNLMASTVLSEDYVFLTKAHDHASTEAIGVVKRYDPAIHLIEFYKVEPNQKVGMVKVRCMALDDERTKVEVTYKYLALSADGEAFIAGFSAPTYDEFIGEWQTLLTDYLASRRQPELPGVV